MFRVLLSSSALPRAAVRLLPLPHTPASALSSAAGQVVSLQHADLVSGVDLSEELLRAYGPGGLGALTIAGIPGYAEARRALVPLAHSVAHLPKDVLTSLEHAPSMYNVGWSHGKEKLGDKPDFAKGSYYGNPLFDQAGSDEMRAKYPYFYPRNIWPSSHLPALEPAFKRLGAIMFQATALLTKQIDAVTKARVPSYTPGLMYNNISNTQKVKGRVLYYFPQPASEVTSEDGWIAWHNDSGFLTALTADMFFDDDTGAIVPNPDPAGGLWILDRTGGPVKVTIPPDELAVQCGECLQIVTGGLMVATPHSVRASKAPAGRRIGRGTFPVFVDTQIDFPLSPPQGVSRSAVFDKTIASRVPPLEDRWQHSGVPFVEFLGTTFQKYYEWSTAKKS